MDIIFVEGIKCDCVIGVWEWEKKITQSIFFDIELGTDITKSAESDKLEDTLSYKAVADRVMEYSEQTRFDLVETLIEKVAQVILDEFPVKWLRIKLNKGPVVKNVKNVGLVIERGTKG